MNKEIVGSREYKIMLKAEKFNGDKQKLKEDVGKFWSTFRKAIADVVINYNG